MSVNRPNDSSSHSNVGTLSSSMNRMQLIQDASSTGATEGDGSKKLNANAPAFVPTALRTGPSVLRQMEANDQPYYDGVDFYAGASMADYQAAAAAPLPPFPSHLNQAMTKGAPNASVLQEVCVGVEQLISEPEEFETWSGAIIDRVSSASRECIELVLELILHMGISIPNASYPISRLLSSMSNHFATSRPGDFDFKSAALFPKLRTLHDQRHNFDIHSRRGLALLIAELYNKITTANGTGFEMLGGAVIDHTEFFLSDAVVRDEENVKCAVQLLKCCGHGFDSSDGLRTRLNSVMHTMTALSDSPGTLPSTKRAIQGVIELRQNNWGANYTLQSNGGVNLVDEESGEYRPLYIGPDGQPLTEEETAFLEAECGGAVDHTVSTESDVDYEQQEAYEQFLREQQGDARR